MPQKQFNHSVIHANWYFNLRRHFITASKQLYLLAGCLDRSAQSVEDGH